MAEDSVVKMIEVLQVAQESGVYIGPIEICFLDELQTPRALTVVPLYSWYHHSFDTEPDLTHELFKQVEEVVPFRRKWGDFTLCSWPKTIISQEDFVENEESTVLSESFAQLNEQFLYPRGSSVDMNSVFGSPCLNDQTARTVISFSHFVPR